MVALCALVHLGFEHGESLLCGLHLAKSIVHSGTKIGHFLERVVQFRCEAVRPAARSTDLLSASQQVPNPSTTNL